MLNLTRCILRRSIRPIQQTIFSITEHKNLSRCYHLNVKTSCVNKVADLTAIQKKSNTNEIIESIKTASNPLEVLDTLTRINKPFNSHQIMVPFKTLFTLQKSKNVPSSKIFQHPEFEKLCKNLQSILHFLDTNSLIDILKILIYLGLTTPNINIINLLLNQIRKNINDLTLGHIVFLNLLLKKNFYGNKRTPLIEAIQLSLPSLFQIKLKEQLDHENQQQLTDLIQFISSCDYNLISHQSIMNVISALTLHGTNLKLDSSKSTLRSLCEIDDENLKNIKIYEKLLFNCFTVLNKNFQQLDYDYIDQISSKLVEKFNSKFELFYNEEFFNKCALYAVENDIGIHKAGFILKKFNKINFVSIILLDYLIEKIQQDPKEFLQGSVGIYLSLITGLSTANYIPKQWDSMKPIILSHPVLKSDRKDLPWIKLCLELISLECYDKNLINKVFDEEFLNKFLSRENNLLDYIQMVNLYQSVMLLIKDYNGNLPKEYHLKEAFDLSRKRQSFPLKVILEHLLGGEQYVCTGVTTKYGHLIDHVIIFNENDEPIPFNFNKNTQEDTNKLVYLEDLPLNHKVITIHNMLRNRYALNSPRLRSIFELTLKTLETYGVQTFAVNLRRWENMPEKERLPYLEREIKFLLKKKKKNVEHQ